MTAKPPAKQPEQDTALAETKKLVRAEVIATYFDVHKRTVAMWAQAGIIPSVKIGSSLRFDMEAVLGASK